MRGMTITWTDFYGLYTTTNVILQIAEQDHDCKRKRGRGREAKKRKREKEPHLSFLLFIPFAFPPPSPVLCRLDCHCSSGLIFRIRNNRFQFHISLQTGSRQPRTKPGREAEAPPSPYKFFIFAPAGWLCSGNFSVLAGSMFVG